MIVDIVQLPRRLSRLNRPDATITSEMAIGFPTSGIYRAFGYWDVNDDECIGIGSQHRVITGKDALFRYKFIEPTKYGLAEYLVLAESPIDVRYPLRNKRVKLYCPWVSIINPRTLRTRKFILWANIFELTHYETEDTVFDAPVEAVIANEVRIFAEENGRPDIAQDFRRYPKNWKDVLVSEEKLSGTEAVDALMQLGSNIRSYNEMVVDTEPYYWCDASDIFRGIDLPKVWTDTTPLKSCTIVSHFMYGSTTIGQLKHLFGMTYDTHAFQRTFNESDLHPYTEIAIYDDNPDLFGILKYIERISYSEFSIVIDANGLYNVKLYNQYDPFLCVKNQDQVQMDKDILDKISLAIKSGYPNAVQTEITRSWCDEIYILIKEHNGKVHRYYFDLVSAALGSRSLIRDYQGRMF